MAKATNAQVKFAMHMLHKLLTSLLLTCYNNASDINHRNMEFVQDTLDRMYDLCYDTGEAVTVQECIDFLQNWRSNVQNEIMLALLLQECNTDSAQQAVLQNA